MVTTQPLPGTQTVVISYDLGNLISKAVMKFAQARGWSAENYDLWYHGEPVWYVRQDEGIAPSTSVVQRVQIAAFPGQDGAMLVFMPDAFIYDWAAHRIAEKPSPTDRAARKQEIPIREVVREDQQEAEAHLQQLIKRAWEQAQQLSQQLATKVK